MRKQIGRGLCLLLAMAVGSAAIGLESVASLDAYELYT